MTLAEAVQRGSIGTVERLLQEGVDANEVDAGGWTPLNWAAAAGDISTAKLLLKFGASASVTGRDLRTPMMIALAAGKSEMASFLRDAASENFSKAPGREYCMAVYLKEMREFAGWEEITSNSAAGTEIPDTTIVYLHADYTITRFVWRDSEVLFDKITPEWKLFCQTNIKFHVPGDLELIAA